KTEFLAAVSHELRTPLNAVMGFTQLLQDTPLTAEQKEYLSMTYHSGEQLLKLINDLLDLSRIESGRFDLLVQSFNLREELNSMLGVLSIKLAESGNVLRVNFAEDLPEVIEADPMRLRQVLINLLSNAIKFTEKGSIEFNVSCSAEWLTLEIKDSGKGIPEDKLEFVFGKFNQVDSSASRAHGGAGLGLAISRRLVESMGGKISVRSKLHKGTTFAVELPLHISVITEQDSETVMQVNKDPDTDQPQVQAMNILLVEDDETNQMIAVALLQQQGHQITIAEHGREAIELCQQEHAFDVILMDIQMPVMDGITATRLLREQGLGVPIIAMTANAMAGDREEYLKAGMDDYISKPIFKAALLQVLHRFAAAS
ncbi:MAG: ATP-binding protein, partial [Gammaproteobacteria bacterium]